MTIATLALASTPAVAKDYSGTALNIIPSGQYGAVPPPPKADRQAKMYDGCAALGPAIVLTSEISVDGRRASLTLLEETDAPVEQVARSVGFDTPVTYRHHFGRLMLTSPSAYRRAFRTGAGRPA